jgi:eukaryotic-like serine/threonine-protein kinase
MPPSAWSPSPKSDTYVPGKACVLVVDDSRTMRALVRSALAGAEVEVLEAGSGEEALALLERSADRIDAVVLDVTLPGLDGYETLAAMRRSPASLPIPVLMLTADATSNADVLRGLRSGAADHLTKPIDPAILLAKVEATVERRRTERILRMQLTLAESRTVAPTGASPLVPGAIVADRYRLGQKLGKGGTAVVYEAEDLELKERVALKVLDQHDSEELLARFKQELAMARRLVHPNLVRVYDFGSHFGMCYFTMEVLDGQTLRSRLVDRPSMLDLCDYLIQLCAGMQVAHDQLVIHRDLKPENAFLTRSNVVKIMDFGIAKRLTASGVTLNKGTIAGTPAYMSPEQIMGNKSIGPAADIYSLGIIAYEMFTGGVPFTHDDVYPLLMRHLKEPPPPPRSLVPLLPKELEELILEMIAKEPEDRPSSCSSVARRLMNIRNVWVTEGAPDRR